MDRIAALQLLASDVLSERLRAARALSQFAEPEDRHALERARAVERTPWVRSAIDRALSRTVSPADVSQSLGAGLEAHPLDDLDLSDESYAAAVQDVSDRLVHELRKIVGRARLYARREITPQETSKTVRELNRLRDFLQGIETLGHAASVPLMEEFDLSQVVAEEVHGIEVDVADTGDPQLRIETYGPAPFLVVADVSLVRLTLSNALQNAVDAARDMADRGPVVVTWGGTDRDVWLAVLDRGVGPPANRDQIFEVGSTTKPGHLGLGLALAERGMLSLGGEIELSRSDDGVTRFEARWPLYGER